MLAVFKYKCLLVQKFKVYHTRTKTNAGHQT